MIDWTKIDKNAYYVYQLKNKINNKKYIGITKDLKKRITVHKSKESNCKCISRAIHKYGFNNFELSIVDFSFDIKDIYEKEKFYIMKFETKSPKGYNLCDGGKGNNGYKHSTETKIYFSKNRKGRKHTEETKKKMGLSQLGRKWDENHKELFSRLKKGKCFSKEHIEKIALKKRGKTINLGIPIIYEGIQYRNINEAAKKNGIKRSTFWARINRQRVKI